MTLSVPDVACCLWQGGLGKLAEAAATVDTLSQEAGQQRSLLKSKQMEAERALQGITVAMESAGSHRQEVSVLQKQLALDQVGSAELQLLLSRIPANWVSHQDSGTWRPVCLAIPSIVGLCLS